MREGLVYRPPWQDRDNQQTIVDLNIYYFTFNGIGNQPAFYSCKSHRELFCVEVVYCLVVLGPAIWTRVSTYVLIEFNRWESISWTKRSMILFSVIQFGHDPTFPSIRIVLYEWDILHEWHIVLPRWFSLLTANKGNKRIDHFNNFIELIQFESCAVLYFEQSLKKSVLQYISKTLSDERKNSWKMEFFCDDLNLSTIDFTGKNKPLIVQLHYCFG